MRGTKASRVCARRHGKGAFTFIELLVVISILVMLMALLLPVVERLTSPLPGEVAAVPCSIVCLLSCCRFRMEDLSARQDPLCRGSLEREDLGVRAAV
ncbi:MAG: type II secretion system protein, partial [Lentisphaeria bacterium]|nr:type II secretion system protein [Lentisphaeria bacterium]